MAGRSSLAAAIWFAWTVSASSVLGDAPPPVGIGRELGDGDGEIVQAGGVTSGQGIGSMGDLTVGNTCPDRGADELVYTWISQDFVDPAGHGQWYQGGWAQLGSANCVEGKLFWGHYDRDADLLTWDVLSPTPNSVGATSAGTFYIALVNNAQSEAVPDPVQGVSGSTVPALHLISTPPIGEAVASDPICQLNIYHGVLGSGEGTAYYTNEYTGNCAISGSAHFVYEISTLDTIENLGSASDATLSAGSWAWLEFDKYEPPTLYVYSHTFQLSEESNYWGYLGKCPEYGTVLTAGGGSTAPGVGC